MARIAEQSCKLSIFDLKRYGYLNKGGARNGTFSWGDRSVSFLVDVGFVDRLHQSVEPIPDPHMKLSYSTGDGQHMYYQVDLVTTPCNYGGERYWFECIKCLRRCGTLFMAGGYWVCRKCGRVIYTTQVFKIVSCRDLDEAWAEIKRFYYKGKPTRRFRRYLRLERKGNIQDGIILQKWAGRLARLKPRAHTGGAASG